MLYTAALAHAEHLALNAARWDSPIAQFAADNARARALCSARAAALDAERLADPIGFAIRAHADACASEEYNSTQEAA